MVKVFKKYNCQICGKVSSQKSHHDAHLNSDHHKTKLEAFKLKLEKENNLKEKYGYSDISKILDMMSGIEPKYELNLKSKSNKVIFELNQKEIKENKQCDEFKIKFKNKLKTWHNLLSGAGVTGDPALDDIIHCLMLCYLDKNKEKFNLLDREHYMELSDKNFEKQSSLLNISELLKSQVNLCKNNSNGSFTKIELLGEVLKLHPLVGQIVKENNFINCMQDKVVYDLLTDINKFCIDYNIFKYSDIIGIAYEFWANEYKGTGGKELGNFFTERMLMRMCFELIDKDDISNLEINNNSTIGDEFCGTFGFPLYLKSFLSEKFKINISNSNIYGVELEDRASKMAYINAMFSLGTLDNIQKGDSFVTNVSSHLDISVHNVPFGKRMKVENIKDNYNNFKEKLEGSSHDVPDFNDIIKVETNGDAVLASQVAIYKTNKMGICIIKDGQESCGTSKKLVEFRKFICDSTNIKKILKIPSGAFSSTGTKTLCFYFVKDGTKTDNIQFLELNEDCNKIIELCNVSYEDLKHNNYLWTPNTYMLDEELEKLKETSDLSWKKLSDICEFRNGKTITRDKLIDGEFPVIGGGKTPMGFHNEYNRNENTILCSQSGNYAGFINKYKKKVWASDCFSIEPTLINNDYLYYFLKDNQGAIYNLQSGAGQPHVYSRYLENIDIPIPTVEIQEKTVKQIKFFEKMINSMDHFNNNQSEGMKFYIDSVLKKNGDNIELKKIGEVCKIEQGKSLIKNDIVNGKYPVIGGGKIIGYHNDFNRKGNEIVITRVGDVNINFFRKKYYLTDNGFSISLNDENNETKNFIKYIYCYLLNSKILESHYNGSSQKVISKTNLLNLQIPIPNLEIQKEIIEYMERIDNIIESNKNLITLYHYNIKEIMSQSF